MKLSQILSEMNNSPSYFIDNDVDFKTLGLVDACLSAPFCTFLDSEKYISSISENAVMVITIKEVAEKITDKNTCIVENPRPLFFNIHNFLSDYIKYSRKRFKTRIGKNCRINKLAHIDENNVIIGNNVTIEEFVVIRENTTIGDNTVIRAGSIIGGEGFEFKWDNNSIFSVKHLGGVIIGKNVNIQYNTCVDKAVYPWDNTVVGDYCKLDNLIHVAHAAKIRENVMIVALSGIGGRTEIKENTWIGFSSTLTNGIIVGKDSRVNIGAVVTKPVKDKESVSGNFAIDHTKFIQHIKSIR